MKRNHELGVQRIPIDLIRVLNPRSRNKQKFQEMIDSIASVGLKRPITVARRTDRDGIEYFATGCGEGRLKAFTVLGQRKIPALIIEATDEELLLISLTENLARRQCAGVEQMWEILDLKERGYKTGEIAGKVGLDSTYVTGILRLLMKGEERLVQAVVKRQLPLRLAIVIASEDDEQIQQALQQAYEDKSLRGNRFLLVKNVINKRKNGGKRLSRNSARSGTKPTSNDLVRLYNNEIARQRSVIAKAKLCETRLLFANSAVQTLFEDEDFITLLRAESLDTLPKYLSDRLH